MAKKIAKKAAPAKKSGSKTAPVKKSVDKAAPVKKVAKKAAEKEKKPAAPKKKAAKRSRTVKEVRLKAFWGVFNQSLRRVALFEYNERKQADKKAAELTKSGKSPHFVQPVKEQIVEG
jgi:hypothetical protein